MSEIVRKILYCEVSVSNNLNNYLDKTTEWIGKALSAPDEDVKALHSKFSTIPRVSSTNKTAGQKMQAQGCIAKVRKMRTSAS